MHVWMHNVMVFFNSNIAQYKFFNLLITCYAELKGVEVDEVKEPTKCATGKAKVSKE